ncbi:MAG: hypothetical protein ABW199_12775 [Caulobacterales bacterium]
MAGLAACAQPHAAAPAEHAFSAEQSALVNADLEGAWRGEAIVRDAPDSQPRRELIMLTIRKRADGGLSVTTDSSEGMRASRVGYVYQDGAVIAESAAGEPEVTTVTAFEGGKGRWRLEGKTGETRVQQALSGDRFRRRVEYKPPGQSEFVVMYAGEFARVETAAPEIVAEMAPH